MSLRETLLAGAEARQEAALKEAALPELTTATSKEPQTTNALSPTHPNAAFLLEEETSCCTSPIADPELAEALARSKALEFSNKELATLRALSSTAMNKVLTNGTDKDRIAAAKLVVLMAKLEKEAYLELRKQNLDSQPKRKATLLQFPSEYLASTRAGLLEGLRNVTPAKESKDA